MKQVFSILSSFVFLFGAAGYYLAFTVADEGAKNAMTERIESRAPQPDIILFTFSVPELKNQVRFTDRNQKEFIYQGENYDVVKSQRDGDRILFTCVRDVRETSLFSFFTRHFDDHSSKNSSSQKISVSLALQDWFFQNDFSTLPLVAFAIYFPSEICSTSDISFQIPSPPPKG